MEAALAELNVPEQPISGLRAVCGAWLALRKEVIDRLEVSHISTATGYAIVLSSIAAGQSFTDALMHTSGVLWSPGSERRRLSPLLSSLFKHVLCYMLCHLWYFLRAGSGDIADACL